jgi:signal transduction histidine kinase
LDKSYLNLIDQVQVKAKLIVPILQQESEDASSNLWGLLIAHNCAAPRQWQPSEIELLSSLATQVAIAIQQSVLYQQTQQQAQREQALNSFISAIRKTLDLETIFATAVQEIKQLLHVDDVEIHQYLPSRQMWLTVAGYQTRPDNLGNLGMETPDVDNEISRQLKQFEVVQIDDTSTLQDAVAPELTQIYSSGAWLLVPLQFQGAFWGCLALIILGRAYHWSEWEVDLVKAIATQLEITIQQGQFYQRLNTLNNNLEGQVQERTGELQQTIQGLEQLNTLKDDFLSTVSHELRSPLANLKMALEMLEAASLTEREHRYLEICQAECNREIDLINDLLDLQRLQAESDVIALTQTVILQHWVPNFVELLHSRAVERQHSVEVDIPLDVPPIISDLKVLERILTELLNNACKYTPAGGEIILRFRYHPEREPPVTIFTISNQAEIPAAALPQVFEKFYRVPNADPWKQGGTGLGLSLVKKLVEHLGGTIKAESGDGWTSFIVEFPT